MKRVFHIVVIAAALAAACTPGATITPAGPTTTPGVETLPPDILTPLPQVGTPIPPAPEGAVVEHPQLSSFEMLNEVDGWGITDSAVLRTSDGGAAWHDVTPPEKPVLGYGAASSYLDNARAFVVAADQADPMHAGTIYRTEDGGANWSSNPVPFGTCQLRFFDMQNGWAMVSLGVATGSNAIAIFQTTDGGKNWGQTFINDPTVAGTSDEIPLGGLKGVFFARDMQTAWVGGVVYSPSTVYLYRTDDGGHHWKPVELPLPPGPAEVQVSIEAIQFVTASDGFLSMQVTGESVNRTVYVTRDAGDTWSLTPTLIPNGRASDFVSQTEGFIFDGDQFQVTRDAGQTWEAVKPDVAFSETFMGMDFVNAQTGWVMASDPSTFEIRLYKTTDGGRTWLPQ